MNRLSQIIAEAIFLGSILVGAVVVVILYGLWPR